MIFPLLYPVVMTGKDKKDHWLAKIKRTNLVMYFLLIVLLLSGIYFSKLSERPF
jgi:cytochrome b561